MDIQDQASILNMLTCWMQRNHFDAFKTYGFQPYTFLDGVRGIQALAPSQGSPHTSNGCMSHNNIFKSNSGDDVSQMPSIKNSSQLIAPVGAYSLLQIPYHVMVSPRKMLLSQPLLSLLVSFSSQLCHSGILQRALSSSWSNSSLYNAHIQHASFHPSIRQLHPHLLQPSFRQRFISLASSQPLSDVNVLVLGIIEQRRALHSLSSPTCEQSSLISDHSISNLFPYILSLPCEYDLPLFWAPEQLGLFTNTAIYIPTHQHDSNIDDLSFSILANSPHSSTSPLSRLHTDILPRLYEWIHLSSVLYILSTLSRHHTILNPLPFFHGLSDLSPSLPPYISAPSTSSLYSHQQSILYSLRSLYILRPCDTYPQFDSLLPSHTPQHFTPCISFSEYLYAYATVTTRSVFTEPLNSSHGVSSTLSTSIPNPSEQKYTTLSPSFIDKNDDDNNISYCDVLEGLSDLQLNNSSRPIIDEPSTYILRQSFYSKSIKSMIESSKSPALTINSSMGHFLTACFYMYDRDVHTSSIPFTIFASHILYRENSGLSSLLDMEYLLLSCLYHSLLGYGRDSLVTQETPQNSHYSSPCYYAKHDYSRFKDLSQEIFITHLPPKWNSSHIKSPPLHRIQSPTLPNSKVALSGQMCRVVKPSRLPLTRPARQHQVITPIQSCHASSLNPPININDNMIQPSEFNSYILDLIGGINMVCQQPSNSYESPLPDSNQALVPYFDLLNHSDSVDVGVGWAIPSRSAHSTKKTKKNASSSDSESCIWSSAFPSYHLWYNTSTETIINLIPGNSSIPLIESIQSGFPFPFSSSSVPTDMSQVFISYGAYPNITLAIQYGFVLLNNKHEIFTIPVELVSRVVSGVHHALLDNQASTIRSPYSSFPPFHVLNPSNLSYDVDFVDCILNSLGLASLASALSPQSSNPFAIEIDAYGSCYGLFIWIIASHITPNIIKQRGLVKKRAKWSPDDIRPLLDIIAGETCLSDDHLARVQCTIATLYRCILQMEYKLGDDEWETLCGLVLAQGQMLRSSVDSVHDLVNTITFNHLGCDIDTFTCNHIQTLYHKSESHFFNASSLQSRPYWLHIVTVYHQTRMRMLLISLLRLQFLVFLDPV